MWDNKSLICYLHTKHKMGQNEFFYALWKESEITQQIRTVLRGYKGFMWYVRVCAFKHTNYTMWWNYYLKGVASVAFVAEKIQFSFMMFLFFHVAKFCNLWDRFIIFVYFCAKSYKIVQNSMK